MFVDLNSSKTSSQGANARKVSLDNLPTAAELIYDYVAASGKNSPDPQWRQMLDEAQRRLSDK